MFWFQQTRPQTTLLLFDGYIIINTLKQELSGTKAYKETSEEEKSVVNGHCNHPFSPKIFCMCQGTPRQTSYDVLVT